MDLNSVGFSHYNKRLKLKLEPENIGRITSEHKTDWDLATVQGKVKAIALTTWRTRQPEESLPKVGDFVRLENIPGEKRMKIIEVLPRFSKLSRIKQQTGHVQILGTNLDMVFIVLGLDQQVNFSQINRYLATAKSEKIKAAIIINKSDVGPGGQKLVNDLKKVHLELDIITTSTKTKIGLSKVESLLKPGHTVAFIGNSGAGKSSIINALLDYEQQHTKSVREDGKGRHTTTRREMLVLPSKAIVIDTPGIRTIEFNSPEQTSQGVFANLDELAMNCKFRNCDHIKSTGCAILDALSKGDVEAEQVKQYLRLRRDGNNNEQLQIQTQRRNKQRTITKSLKNFYKNKK